MLFPTGSQRHLAANNIKYYRSRKVIASSMTSPHTLSSNVFTWNFDEKHIDMILGHNVEQRGSMLKLPISVLECTEEAIWRGRLEIWLFQGVNLGEIG